MSDNKFTPADDFAMLLLIADASQRQQLGVDSVKLREEEQRLATELLAACSHHSMVVATWALLKTIREIAGMARIAANMETLMADLKKKGTS
jgi:hypothetical protein